MATLQEQIRAIAVDVENLYNGNRTAKMRAIFELVKANGITDPREQRQACELPELWAPVNGRGSGRINTGAIWNVWGDWSGVRPRNRRGRTNATSAQPTQTAAPAAEQVDPITGITYPAPATSERVDYNAFTFGVEFEGGFKARNGRTAQDAIAELITIAEKFGIEVVNVGCASHADSPTAWRICTDSSVKHRLDDTTFVSVDSGYDREHSGMREIVSPILMGRKGWRDLEIMCMIFEKVDFTVNRTCGTHVHIGVKDEVWATLRNVGVSYSLAYNAYCKIMPKSRRATDWAKNYTETEINALRNYTRAEQLYQTGGICSDARNSTNLQRHYARSRYHAVNYVALKQRGTLEFRQHNATVEFRKIQTWIKDKMELITWSRSHVLTETTEFIDGMLWQSEDTRCNFEMRVCRFSG